MSIGMIFYVGVMSQNPKHVPWGLWTLFGTTAIGALLASESVSLVYLFV